MKSVTARLVCDSEQYCVYCELNMPAPEYVMNTRQIRAGYESYK